MLEKINGEVCRRLIQDYSFKQAGLHLREGKCPECGKKTLWTWLEKPGSVQCDRVGKCGWQATSKELYPDLFEKLNQNYAATPEDPNRTANAYMELVRGIAIGHIKQWWAQGKYWNPNGDKGTATVRFNLTEDGKVYWERFVEDVWITDPDTGEKSVRKSRASGAFKGMWWCPPNQDISIEDTVYLTEGIIDAISLIQNGQKACAIMSSGTFPDDAIKPHLGKKVTWILALDNDIAGRKAIKKHALKLAELQQNVRCALTSEGLDKCDWNDLHIRRKINPEYMQDYRYYGDLELAKSANNKALVTWRRNPLRKYFVFTFGNQTYRFKMDEEEFAKAYDRALEHFGNPSSLEDTRTLAFKTPGNENEDRSQQQAFNQIADIKDIANFRLEYLYSQLPATGDDGWYFLKINYSNGQKPYQCAVGGDVFGEAKRFKKAMQVKAHGALFTGLNTDMDYMYKNWFNEAQKTVRVLDFIGYDEDTDAYVYPHFAVQNGKVIPLNDQHFFTLKDIGIKTSLDIGQRLTTNPPVDFWEDFVLAFGLKGVITLAWFVGSLVCVQIREKHSSFPFLQLIGEKSSGKSALMGFIWKLAGKNNDNFNPNVSSVSGRYREMSKYSNLPIMVNEVDNENEGNAFHGKKFQWDEQKDLYEGFLGRVTGHKSNDNSTRKPIFRGAFAATQNIDIRASEAMLARFVYINFDKSHHSEAGYHAAARLRDLDITDVSGFLLQAVSKANLILDAYNQHYVDFRREVMAIKGIDEPKVITNYAQMMALTECLKMLVPITQAQVNTVHELLKKGAWHWQQALEGDHSIVAQFWYNVEYLNSHVNKAADGGDFVKEDLLNHSNTPMEEIAISLEHYVGKCREAGLETVSTRELRQYLPSSKRYKYLKTGSVRSRIEQRVLRCMVFNGPLRAGME
jgi:Toprim-like